MSNNRWLVGCLPEVRSLKRGLICCGVLLISALGCWSETVVLDAMETNHSAWGPGREEKALVKEGQAALRWQPQDGPLRRDDLAINLAKYRSLRLWVYAPAANFARYRLEIPVPGGTAFSLTFKGDWQGWNRLELYDEIFQGGGADRVVAWGQARGLVLTQTHPGFVPGELVLDGLEISTDYPQLHFNDHEVLIDWPYWSARQLKLWKPTAETSRRPADTWGFDPYWCWSWMWVVEDPDRRDVCAYTREFDTDLTGYSTLEVRASNDDQGFLTVHLQVDGQWSTPVQYVKGTSQFQEIQVPLPVGGRRLTAVTLDISEPPDQIGGSRGRQLKCNVQWLLLRKPGAPLGEPPVGRPRIEPIPLTGSLEETGLPGAVYFGRQDLPAIRRLFTEGAAKTLGARVIQQADAALGGNPEAFAGRWLPQTNWVGKRSNDKSYNLSGNARTCALAYVITGDKKYADFARRCLVTMAGIEQWSDGYFARYPLGWGGHGNTFVEAAATYDAGLAYDWIYNALSPEERRLVGEAILSKGIWWVYDLLDRNPGILKMNQGVVFDAQMGVALLALEPQHPELAAMRQQSAEWLWTGLEAYSFTDGESNEGIGYWHYTWNTAVRLLAALGQRDPEGVYRRAPDNVKRSLDWIVHMKSNNSPARFLGIFHCDGGGGAPAPAVAAFFAKYLKDPTGAWFQQQSEGPTDELAAFMWEHDTPAVKPPMILARHFRDAGMIFLREGFEYGDTCFMLLGSPPLPGHNQRDRTAFMIEAHGEYLAMDPGMINYANPIHTSLAKTRLHNALTIDGQDGTYDSKVTGFFSSPLLDYAAVDGTATYPQSRRYVRQALFLRPDHFVILDDMQLKTPGRIEWNLNSAGELSLQGSRVVSQALKSSLVCDFVGTENLQIEKEVWPCGMPGVRNNHGTLFTQPQSDSAHFQVSLYPVRRGQEEQVRVTPLTAPGYKGLVIRFGDLEERVYERRGEGTLNHEGLQAEGELAVVRLWQGKLTGAAVLGGQSLQWQGRPLVQATAPGNYAVAYRDGSWLVASVQAPAGTKVTLPPPPGYSWRGAQSGEVAGHFQPAAGFDEASATFTLPEKQPLAGCWLLGNKPEGLVIDDDTLGRVAEFVADDKPVPGGVLPDGVVPQAVALRLEPGANPLDPDSLQTFFNGRALKRDQWQVSEQAGGLTVSLKLADLLSPEDRQPEFYTTHTLEVAGHDRGVMQRRVRGVMRFTLRPKLKDDVVYLSDIEPVSFQVHGSLFRDRGYSVERIKLAGIDYPKGLTTHPKADGGFAEVIYDLRPYHGKRNTFRALVGMPMEVPGSVQFRVYTRARGGEWQQRCETDIMGPGTPPVDLSVPLAGADELRLYVTDGGNGHSSDHAAWALARLE
jgi:hypothetical protein